jgi:Predicted GTPase
MDEPFIFKYRPQNLDDLELHSNLKQLITLLIKLNELNILIVGDTGSGKSSLINIILKLYFNSSNIIKNENILYINNLNEQGIHYFRTGSKDLFQTTKLKKRK